MSAEDLLGARAAAERVLEHLGLRNYRFDVEPREGGFDVFVEHERDGAWHVARLSEDDAALLDACRDASTCAAIAERWRERLVGHDRGSAPPP